MFRIESFRVSNGLALSITKLLKIIFKSLLILSLVIISRVAASTFIFCDDKRRIKIKLLYMAEKENRL